MELGPFDRETLLDLTINMVPIGIMVFFIGAFALVNPFGWDAIVSTLQFGIMIVTTVLLLLLTYYAGKVISEAEAEMEAAEEGAETTDTELEEDAVA